MDHFHIPVLLQETIELLCVQPGKKYIDATFGGGGHSREILHRGGVVLGLDVDPQVLSRARHIFQKEVASGSLQLVQGNFRTIDALAHKNNFERVGGILFDLGMSSFDLEGSGRGFSFLKNEPLDMRMDLNLSVTAANLINGLSHGELYELFTKLGQEHRAERMALSICRSRRIAPIKTTAELADVIEKASGGMRWMRGGKKPIHPATKIFQALRIAVNDELNNVKTALPFAYDLLEKNGRMAVISFHSLEDGIVKLFFRELAEKKQVRILTPKPVRPAADEVRLNSRSRSARLRAAEKTEDIHTS